MTCLLIFAFCCRAFADPAPVVTAADQLQFQQKTAETQMQELQERMYRLADLTRDTEPDDASRLLMALRQAREGLIIEQMRDVVRQLTDADYSNASEQQAQVLVKLEELKKLLTSSDLDLQIQLQRLRALNSAIAKLDKAIVEEKRQRDQSAALDAKNKLGKLDPKSLAPPRQEQQQNRQATEAIAQTVKDLGPAAAKAGQILGTATQGMSVAEGRLGAGSPSDAQGLQSQAAQDMQTARDQLDKERQKILTELQGQVRKQVIENLTEMLDRQKSVRGATEAVVMHSTSQTLDRATLVRVKQLGAPEQAIVRISDQTLDLINETEFSIALPPALKEIRSSCVAVGDHLDSGVANAPLVNDEKQIEHDLADLIDTFKQLNEEPGDPSQCHCKGNKNKLLAELKVIRMMQTRVNLRTVRADAERGAATQPSPDAQANIIAIRDSQQDIQTAADKIHRELSGEN